MNTQVPVRILAQPEQRRFTEDDGSVREPFLTHLMLGGEPVKFYTDDDPTRSLNGARERLAAGEIVEAVAELRLYARRSGLGVALEALTEPETRRK